MEQKKIYIVGSIEYNADGTSDCKIYKDVKPYTDEVAAMVAHRNNISELASFLYSGEDIETENDYYQEHMNDTHITENIGDNIVKLWIEEFKFN